MKPYATTFAAEIAPAALECQQCGRARPSSIAVLCPRGDESLPEHACLLIRCQCGSTVPLPLPARPYEPSEAQLAELGQLASVKVAD